MYSFADEVLNRVRTPPQALADLMARYKGMDFNHPGRLGLAQMIAQLKTEIALREGTAFDLRPAAWGWCGDAFLP